jgi:hypothetical protein
MSFAFDPVKWDYEEEKSEDNPTGIGRLVRNLVELRLWDTSDVNWGMNPLTVAVKTVIPYKDTGTADEGEAWSRPTLGDFSDGSWDDMSAAEKQRIAAHFAWSGSRTPESYGDLKLPHHKPQKNGVGPAVWRGVRGAMNVLMGGRGGADIPDSDRAGIYRHLVKHYEQFDKEPPDLKFVNLSSMVSEVLGFEQLDLGREVLGQEMAELAAALEIAQRILLAAEPPQVKEKDLVALTERTLYKLEIAQRQRMLVQGE